MRPAPCPCRADLLLQALTGRYVWINLAAYPAGECDWTLRGLRLEFPKESFTKYFPEIYRGDDFFDCYISVFQSRFLDLERPRVVNSMTAFMEAARGAFASFTGR